VCLILLLLFANVSLDQTFNNGVGTILEKWNQAVVRSVLILLNEILDIVDDWPSKMFDPEPLEGSKFVGLTLNIAVITNHLENVFLIEDEFAIQSKEYIPVLLIGSVLNTLTQLHLIVEF
jgi:hypothetical protein